MIDAGAAQRWVRSPFTWRVPLVILGAGRGRRLGAAALGLPKVLLPMVSESPGTSPVRCLLELLIECWGYWASTVHLVVARRSSQLEAVLERIPRQVVTHLQPEPTGTVSALMQIRQELCDNALVVLGDCLLAGRLSGPPAPFPGLVAWRGGSTQAIQANYAVDHTGTFVRRVQEKPRQVLPGQLCGTGVYFINQALLEAFTSLPANPAGRREITDGLDHALQKKVGLQVILLDGTYVNINTATDLDEARKLFRQPC